MEVYISDIRAIANRFLEIINKEELFLTNQLEKMTGKRISSDGDCAGSISFGKHPSNIGTMAHNISYIRYGVCVPIEIQVNAELDYSQIILKAQYMIEGYSFFAVDRFKNIAQN